MNAKTPAYVVVPLHTVNNNDDRFLSAHEALQKAAVLVEKDRQPRAVVQVVADVRPSPRPQVEVAILRDAEVGNG